MHKNWSRPYLEDFPQRPHLFFAALGEFQIDAKFQQMAQACLYEELGCRLIEASYFRDGPLWDMAEEPARTAAQQSRDAVVIEGEVYLHQDLEYLRKAIDLLTYCCEEGAKVIFDPYCLAWFERSAWLERAEEGQIFNPFDHVTLLLSDGWYHTRGLLKFGRPDLSVRGVRTEEAEGVKKMIDRFINFQALGGVIEEGRPITMQGLDSEFVTGPVRGDRDDPDFNNCHVELLRLAPS